MPAPKRLRGGIGKGVRGGRGVTGQQREKKNVQSMRFETIFNWGEMSLILSGLGMDNVTDFKFVKLGGRFGGFFDLD